MVAIILGRDPNWRGQRIADRIFHDEKLPRRDAKR
jgi:hypothetical protein